MKKVLSMAMAFLMLFVSVSYAGQPNAPADPPFFANGQSPESPPDGLPEGMGVPGTPPEMPDGQMPSPPGEMPGGMGSPGMQSAPETRTAVNTCPEDAVFSGQKIASAGKDENAILVTGGKVSVTGSEISRESNDSTGGDSASFYGVGAALLAAGGELTVSDSVISTDAEGGAGVFAYGSGIVHVSRCTISTERGASGGIHAAGGGTLYADDLTVTTGGASSASIRSDRGGGTMIVNGGSYTSAGSGSPAVYVTADITVSRAKLNAAGSEALCLEGRNRITLNDCVLEGNMPDQEQNDTTWTVILYQSMSGDSEVGKGTFVMNGGKLISHNGGIFYTTNTVSEFSLKNVEIVPSADCEYLLRCTGNANRRGWGRSEANGAECTFVCDEQLLTGTVIWDRISALRMELDHGSILTGALVCDPSYPSDGGNGSCMLTVDESSKWIVTGNSELTGLVCKGTVEGADGRAVRIVDRGQRVLAEGDSIYTVTVDTYSKSE